MNDDLISRSVLLEKANKVFVTDDAVGMGIQIGIETAKEWIMEAPAVDAVEVVRCKDCKCWDPVLGDPQNRGRCIKSGLDCVAVKASDFCSYGERRADGDSE